MSDMSSPSTIEHFAPAAAFAPLRRGAGFRSSVEPIEPSEHRRTALDRTERWLLGLTIIVATALIWLAPRPPLVDLPQHAGQVALWRDLLLGTSPWSDLVRINLLTPYLIGYGAILPLSLLFPIGISAKIVLTLAWFAFVAAGWTLRRALGADPKLDWLLLWGFFGFAWHWGLLTFLVAAPLALIFIRVALAQTAKPTSARCLLVIVAGSTLLFSHGLLFLFGLLVGGLLAASRSYHMGLRALPKLMLPYGVLGCLCVLFRLVTGRLEGSMQFDRAVYGIPIWMRPSAVIVFVTDQDNTRLTLLGLTLLMVASPWLLRCRLNRNAAIVIVMGLGLVLVALPAYAYQTDLLFQRFALFFLPILSLVFRSAEPGDLTERRRLIALVAVSVATWCMFGVAAARIIAFRAECKPFETVLAAARPGRRALGLIYGRDSPAAVNDDAYLHFPVWYQAEKQGFVDFNFAAFHPQVVRFNPDRIPPVDEQMGHDPRHFDSKGTLYDYIFVREKSGGEAAQLIRTSLCRYDVAAADGPWVLLERISCPP